ncbi:MAG: zinc-ribbon domain-containing protein [Crocinitomicaceae bacterium]|nr:zinc-ribbon domain-containing protein [Crocinitomicaceae bacterium]
MAEVESVSEEECKICSKKTKAIYSFDQGYFLLYGLPLFPSSKKYYITCPECDAQLKAKSSDANFRKAKSQMNGKFKFKYVWGWLILGPILFGLIYLIASVKS